MAVDLFYEELIRSYIDEPRFIARPWLAKRIDDALADPAFRFLLLTSDPGAGKTTFMAWLAYRHPMWPRYFIRRDQITPFSDVGTHSFLLQIGFQLAASHPTLFTRENMRVVIEQCIGSVHLSGEAIAADIDNLFASPFYQMVMRIRQEEERNDGKATGILIGEWITDPRLFSISDLQFMALIDPANALLKQDPHELLVLLVDALDELRIRNTEQSVLNWLTACPALPPNIRFVLTSRSDEALLATFRGAQQRWLREITISSTDPQLIRELQIFALRLTEEQEVKNEMKVTGIKVDDFVSHAVDKAAGNIGFLGAIGREIDRAVKQHDQQTLFRLLDLSNLPDALEELYAFFLYQLKAQVDQLHIEVEYKEGEIQ